MDPSANVYFAFALTLLAGLSTGIGGALAVLRQKSPARFMAAALGFSAGVMIYVSMVDILPKAREHLSEALGAPAGNWAATGAFFGGMLLIALIDALIPERENPHEAHRVEELSRNVPHPKKRLLRTGLMLAGVIALHNFPEGLATFVSALESASLGVAIAGAIAIHNIPEGIAVAVPIYQATGSRKKAFLASLASGALEPLGALAGYFLLGAYLDAAAFGIIFAGVAGIMVFISIDELLPSARQYGAHHLSIYGMMAGMAVMAVSLLLFLEA